MELVVATGHGAPGLFHDDAGLPAAFEAHGIAVDVRPWQEIVPGESPVLIRTAWDYTQHIVAFRAWLDAAETAGAFLMNPAATLRWNMDKRYLLDLEAKGHAIVPTRVLDAYSPAAVWGVAEQEGWADVIAKPCVGGGAEGLVRMQDGRVHAFDLAGNQWAPEAPATPTGPCLVQPFQPTIETGEWSLFFFGGRYSHAVRKRPAAGDIRVQEEHGGTTRAQTPPQRIVDAGEALVAEVDAVYARVDGLDVDGRFLLMELELIEPELYFRYAPGAEAVFAAAVAAAIRGSGAGLPK